MKVLLLAGLGPYFKNDDVLAGTLFDTPTDALDESFRAVAGRPIRIADLHHTDPSGTRPLLRPSPRHMSHLPGATLSAILESAGAEYELFSLERVWAGDAEPAGGSFDVVALSTSFICDRRTLQRAVEWIVARYPDATLVLGGQFSNLKYRENLAAHPEIDFAVRGDGEVAFPRLLEALAGKRPFDEVPNLVTRGPNGKDLVTSPIEYVDLNAFPSPTFHGRHERVPYESMRGCPFTCRFCSYPSASPRWRFKSAEKIVRDWTEYAERNGAGVIMAMDSTFTVPPKRFREVLRRLPEVDVTWEAYSRTDDVDSPEVVEMLEAAHCRSLSFGFESMNDSVLVSMSKGTTAADNARAITLLADSKVDYRGAFMVGYPGETPEAFAETRRYLVDEFVGRFLISVFAMVDETMPVWEDATKHRLRILDPNEPAYSWTHAGMDIATARKLMLETMADVRWKNESGVLMLWQLGYELPLVPSFSHRKNRRIEKLVERLAFLVKDWGHGEEAKKRFVGITRELESLGVGLPGAFGALSSPSATGI